MVAISLTLKGFTPMARAAAILRGSAPSSRCARARAWLHERDFVSPEDIQAVAPNVLRHRLLLSYQAQAEGVSRDQVINHILTQVAVP